MAGIVPDVLPDSAGITTPAVPVSTTLIPEKYTYEYTNFTGFCHSLFWDANVTWNTEDPDLTPCFHYTAMVWIPAVYMLCILPFQYYWYKWTPGNIRKWTSMSSIKFAFNLMLVMVSFACLIYAVIPDHHATLAYLIASIIRLIMWIFAFLLVYWDRRKGYVTSGPLFVFWFWMLFSQMVLLRSAVRHNNDTSLPTEQDHTWWIWTESISLIPIVVIFVLSCYSDIPHDRREAAKENPEMTASFLNKLLFSWFGRMMSIGYRRPLVQTDMYAPNPDDRTGTAADRFDRVWNNEVDQWKKRAKKAKPGQKLGQPSLLLALAKSFYRLELAGALCLLATSMLGFAGPYIMRALITFIKSDKNTTKDWHGYWYSTIMILMALLMTVLNHQYNHLSMRLGMMLRSAMSAAVYRKSLRMSAEEKRKRTVGETVNLMSVDANRLQDLMGYVNMAWSAPLQLVICVALLYAEIGYSCFAGFSILVISLPTDMFIVKISRRLQMHQITCKDDRIKSMTEILDGMKVLKLYAWEWSFAQLIDRLRSAELHSLLKMSYLNAGANLVYVLAPFMVSFVSFLVFILNGGVLTPERAFTTLALFNILKGPLTILPAIIAFAVQAIVSVERLTAYFTADELDSAAVDVLPSLHVEDDVDFSTLPPAIEIENGTFRWSRSDPEASLADINLRIPQGTLVAIVGASGSGKSTLVSTLLGLLIKNSGTVRVRGKIGYVPQQAWIQQLSVKDNILFSNPWNEEAFNCIVNACALRADFNMWPAREETQIGEKGGNLSGGQRQRLSIARAVYANADVYIFDDPLSAVDAHVGKHIFQQTIGRKGLLKRKTRFLVTHGLSYLPKCDYIIVMKNGRISEMGTYRQLLETSQGEFVELLKQEVANAEDEEHLNMDPQTRAQCDDIYACLRRKPSGEQAIQTIAQLRRNQSIKPKPKPTTGGDPLKQSKEGAKKAPLVVAQQLVADETSGTGAVPFAVYAIYVKFMQAWAVAVMTTFFVAFCGLSGFGNIWLAWWSNYNLNMTDTTPIPPGWKEKNIEYLWVYGLLGVIQTICISFSSFSMAYGTLIASKTLHDTMMGAVMRAPMSFFDTTPVGRILNRFSKDVDVVDSLLPVNFRLLILTILQVVATIVVVLYAVWPMVVVIPPLLILYYLVQLYYIGTSRQLKRLESVSRSPVYSHFQESISGAALILATNSQVRFILENENRIDTNNVSYYPSIVAQRWLGIRLETVGNAVVLFVCVFSVINHHAELIDTKETFTPSKVGLAISYALSITNVLSAMVKASSDIESNIVAVERIKEYMDVPSEAPLINENNRVPPGWPPTGVIKFTDYKTRYRAGLDLVLKGVDAHIMSGEKIGIVGRTGAGKSSLTLALFRLVEPVEGQITIDDLDITSIGLNDLRSRLTIIPQEPILFSGSLRMNLDPFNQFSDEKVWEALELAHLKHFASALPGGLQGVIAEAGANVSVGQRQMLCLARALLKKTAVLVLDEATAAVDMETDALVQKTLRKEFKECTVLTIAHRIITILDSTRIMVLDAGRVSEFDTPANLLKNPDGVFYKLCKNSGLINNPNRVGGVTLEGTPHGGGGARPASASDVKPQLTLPSSVITQPVAAMAPSNINTANNAPNPHTTPSYNNTSVGATSGGGGGGQQPLYAASNEPLSSLITGTPLMPGGAMSTMQGSSLPTSTILRPI